MCPPTVFLVTIKVNNEDELENWRQSILSKPMFLDVFCTRRVALGVVTIVYKIYFAVLVNTRHPQIRQQLERGFGEAKRLMGEGKDFSIEFDFTTPVREWYSVASQQSSGSCSGSIFGKYGRVCITNSSKYASCFRCTRETAPWWVLCLPCCLLTCPCYAIHRGVTCEDIEITIGGEVTLMIPEHIVAPYLQAAAASAVHNEYIERPAAIMIQPARPPTYEESMRDHNMQTNDTRQLLPPEESESNRV
ncbi:uncharacterized protein [Ptychodera flava]|uniref:uncharacterized protein isoform X2 n=1 Tax=Ptychodera flava TaxID=63121 RepID=UPI00396A4E87